MYGKSGMDNSRTVKFIQDILLQESNINEFGNNFHNANYNNEHELKRDIRNAIKKLRTFRKRKQLEKEFGEDIANAKTLLNEILTVEHINIEHITDKHNVNNKYINLINTKILSDDMI